MKFDFDYDLAIMRTDLRMIFIDDAVKNLINFFPQ